MKYRHYAPVAPLHLVDGDLQVAVGQWKAAGKRVGVLADTAACGMFATDKTVVCVPCGVNGSTESFAYHLYASLRAFDGEGEHAVSDPVDVILAVPPSNIVDGIGEAVMNRLRKAAAGRDEKVPIPRHGV